MVGMLGVLTGDAVGGHCTGHILFMDLTARFLLKKKYFAEVIFADFYFQKIFYVINSS